MGASSPAQLALPALSLAMAVFCTCLGKESTREGKGFPGSDLMQLGIAGGRWASSGCKSLLFSYRIRILLPQVVPGRKVMWEGLVGKYNRDVCLAEQDGERLLPQVLHGDCRFRAPPASALLLSSCFFLMLSRPYLRKGDVLMSEMPLSDDLLF